MDHLIRSRRQRRRRGRRLFLPTELQTKKPESAEAYESGKQLEFMKKITRLQTESFRGKTAFLPEAKSAKKVRKNENNPTTAGLLLKFVFLLSNLFAAKQANTSHKKQKSEPFGSDFLVDDTRLELVTSRTSSGCATSCANRPCSIVARGILANGIGIVKNFFRLPEKTSGSLKSVRIVYGLGTQTLQLAATPPHSATISAQPGPTAVTRPVSSTVMMLSSEERHSSFAVVTASTG